MKHSALKTGKFFELEQNMTALCCMPSEYIAGKMMIIRALVLRLNLVCEPPSLTPIKNIRCSIDFAAMTPMQMQYTLNHNHNTSLLNKVILGGAPVSVSLSRKTPRSTFYMLSHLLG